LSTANVSRSFCAAIFVVCALALGCSGSDDDADPTTTTDASGTTIAPGDVETLPSCDQLEGDVDLEAAGGGCMLADDTVGVVVSDECDDGRIVVQVGDRLGVEGGQWQPAENGVSLTELC
jgi:hypothetical protein